MGIGAGYLRAAPAAWVTFPLTIAGAALSALRPACATMLGQLLIGVGCSPPFLTPCLCRHFRRTASLFFGDRDGHGQAGLLFAARRARWSSTCGDWHIAALGTCAAQRLSWLLIFSGTYEPTLASDSQPKPGFMQALKGFGSLLLLPHT